MTDISRLDGQELLHLAVEASGRNDHGAAIAYLKQAVDLRKEDAASSTEYGKLLYLLGAEYAQIGMMERAQEHISLALQVAPHLHTARFQLGLLYLSCAQPQQAMEALAPLSDLGASSPLFHMKQGLEHLMRDEFEPCRTSLLKGMELNSKSADFNAALNGDMQKLLNALPVIDDANPEAESTNTEASFLMSAYNRRQPN